MTYVSHTNQIMLFAIQFTCVLLLTPLSLRKIPQFYSQMRRLHELGVHVRLVRRSMKPNENPLPTMFDGLTWWWNPGPGTKPHIIHPDRSFGSSYNHTVSVDTRLVRALLSKQGRNMVSAIGKQYKCRIDLRSLQGATAVPQHPGVVHPPLPPGHQQHPRGPRHQHPRHQYPRGPRHQHPGGYQQPRGPRHQHPGHQYPRGPRNHHPRGPRHQYPQQQYPGMPGQQPQTLSVVNLAITSPSKKVASLVRRDLEQWLRVQAPHVIVTDRVDCEHPALHNLHTMARKLPSAISKILSQRLGIHDVAVTVQDRGNSTKPHKPQTPRGYPRSPRSPRHPRPRNPSPKPTIADKRTLQLRGPCMRVALLKQHIAPDAFGDLTNLLTESVCIVTPFTAAQEKRARVIQGVFNSAQTKNQFYNDDEHMSAFLALRTDVVVIKTKAEQVPVGKLIVRLCSYDQKKLQQAQTELHTLLNRIIQQKIDLTFKEFSGKYIQSGTHSNLFVPFDLMCTISQHVSRTCALCCIVTIQAKIRLGLRKPSRTTVARPYLFPSTRVPRLLLVFRPLAAR